MTIVCYGDSNTYGWDPRFFSGDRYEHPWPQLLADMTGYKVINCGEPGRTVPYRKEHLEWFQKDVLKHEPDVLIIMLGTNDVINLPDRSADETARRMEAMVSFAVRNRLAKTFLLLSCPKINMQGELYEPVLADLADKYKSIAQREKIYFADPFRWDIPLAFDGVHFSEEGHRVFAKELSAQWPYNKKA